MFMEQLEDLLDHVLPPQAPVDLFVGHSTGGVVGILASARLAREVNNLALVSPALWAEKPCLANIADQFPNVIHNLLSAGLLHFLIKDSYIKNTDNAFAKDSQTGKHLFQDAYDRALARNTAMFQRHPFALAVIAGVNFFFLSAAENASHREVFREITTRAERPARVHLIWGMKDTVVDYHQHSDEAVAFAPGRVSLAPLPDQGHESFDENTATIAAAIKAFVQLR